MAASSSWVHGPAGVITESASGVTQELAFFGNDVDRLYGATHLPAGPARAAVLVCSPLHNELLNHQRRETLLGRELSRRGVAVQRFHYTGTGQSDGDPRALTLETLERDARAALSELRGRVGADVPVAVAGTRLGAVVAAAVATTDRLPTAFWEPVVGGEDYFRQALRARRMQEVIEQLPKAVVTIDELRSTGEVDVAGVPMTYGLYESLTSKSLPEMAAALPAALVVQFRNATELNGTAAKLAAALTAADVPVQTATVEIVDETWWFFDGFRRITPAVERLIDLTCNWVLQTLRCVPA